MNNPKTCATPWQGLAHTTFALLTVITLLGSMLAIPPRTRVLAAGGVTVSLLSGPTTETGGTATFTVALSNHPGDPVTIPLRSDDLSEGAVSPIELNFDGANWDSPQTVTVTGVNDDVDDGDITYTIVLSNSISLDPDYDDQPVDDVSVTNQDDDTAGITLTESGGSTSVTEGGATDTYTLVLTSQPTASVSVAFDTGSQLQAIGSISFTDANWNDPQTIGVAAVDDFIDEDAHTGSIVHTVSSADPNYNAYALASVSASISDNDTAAYIITPTSGLTTTENLGADFFTARLATQPEQVVVVNLASLDTTEGAPFPTTIAFSPANWSTPVTVTVTGVDDFLDDDNQAYTIQNSQLTTDPKYSLLDPADVSVVNLDNDGPTINISDASVTEGNSGSIIAIFTVTLNQASPQTIRVDYNTAPGTAVSPADFTALSNQRLTFAPGDLSKTIQVSVLGDTFDEDDSEIFNVVLNNPRNADIGDGFGQGSILDDDPLPTLSIADASTTEAVGGATASFVVTLTGSTNRTVTVDYAATPGTAASPADFTAQGSSLSFAPGEHQKTIDIAVADDLLDEDSENFSLNLSGAAQAEITDGSAVGTIIDNDIEPTLSVASTSILEGDTGSDVTAVFTLTLSAASGRTVSAQAATINGTAIAPDDYTPRIETLTFVPGQRNLIFLVTIKGDVLNEDNETFNVSLTGVNNALYVTQPITGTIEDNDLAPHVDILDASVTEGNSGTTTTAFTIRLSAASGRNITLTASTSPDTATSPADYATRTQNFTFTPGQTEKTFQVTVVCDQTDEDNEIYNVDLSNLNRVDAGDTHAVGTIIDDDTAALVTVPAAGLETSEDGTQAGFTVALASQPLANITVDITSSDTGEGSIVTPTLTFTTANWNVAQKSAVRGVADSLDDGDIAYVVRLNPGGDARYNALPVAEISAVNRDKNSRIFLPVAVLEHIPAPMPVFTDDFGSNKSWQVFAVTGGTAEIIDGAYTLRHTTAGLNIRAVAPSSAQTSAYKVEVTASRTAGSASGARFGLLFDWLDEFRFYRLVLDPTAGTWQVQKFASTYQTVMGGSLPGSLQYPAALKVERDALNIRVYINGQLMGEVQDGTYANGKVGVIMVSPATLNPGAYGEASFDTFSLTPLHYSYQNQFTSAGLEQGWNVTASPVYTFTIDSAALRLEHGTPNLNVRAVSPLPARTSPYYVSVQTRLAPGADSGTRYGILFGWLDSSRFYRFIVDPAANQYLLQKWTGAYQVLHSGSLPAGFSATGGATLMVKRNGSQIDLYINGIKLKSLSDPTYLNGKAGVIVIAPVDLQPAETSAALFDNFEIGPLP